MAVERGSPQPDTIPVFPIIRDALHLSLREGSEMDYALSVILNSQPQINLLGPNADRVTKDQVLLVINGIKEGGNLWLNLKFIGGFIPQANKSEAQKRELDWQR